MGEVSSLFRGKNLLHQQNCITSGVLTAAFKENRNCLIEVIQAEKTFWWKKFTLAYMD